MKKLVLLVFSMALALPALAQKQSEVATAGTVTNVIRLVSVSPTYSDESTVTLLSVTETFKQFTVLPGGSVVNSSTFTRQWTSANIAALPDVWTNSNAVVFTNNVFKSHMTALWTRFDNQPERATLTFL